jgi:hypothetical protein
LPDRRRVPPQPLFLLVFLGLAGWMYAPAWASPVTTLAGGNGDAALFLWFLRWTPFALEHGHDLLVSHHLNYPECRAATSSARSRTAGPVSTPTPAPHRWSSAGSTAAAGRHG